MKRHFTFLMAAFALMVSMMMPLGMKGQTRDEAVVYTLDGTQTGGNNGYASSDIHTDNTGWSFSKEFGAYKCAKFGTGSAKGVATTPSISFTGNATLTFKAGAWNGSSEKTTLAISATGGTLKQNGNTINSVTMVKGAWTTYTVDVVGVTSSVKITFQGSQASNNRFFLDEIVVSQVASVVATPTFSPAAGSFDSPQNVTISCATENATIYYTTDGTMPTTSSTTYSSAIAVSSTTTIKAIAVKEGMSNSAVATAEYVIRAATPTFTPEAGTYTSPQNVTISCATTGATIYYTTDGSTPTTSSNVYSPAISVSETTTIKAIAVKSGMDNSEVASATYTINLPHTVTFDPGNGTCSQAYVTEPTGTSITLPTATPSAVCANWGWTFAGWATSSIAETTTAPTLLTGSYTIAEDATLFAVYKVTEGNTTFDFADIAEANQWENGEAYTSVVIDPVKIEALGGGNNGKWYTSVGGSWRLYSGGTVRVSASGIDVTDVTSSPACSFTITDGIATFSPSARTDFTCITVTCGTSTTTYDSNPACLEQVATPTFSPAAGSYTEAQDVTISCSTEDATIYYTTDGTTPTTSSSVYSSAIAVTETTTIKAMATKANMANSNVTAGIFTIVSTINVSDTPTLPFPYEGGQGFFNFSITNPVTGATVTAEADNWITPTVSELDGTVEFEVAVSYDDARQGSITLSYKLNGTTLTTAVVSISQEANPYELGTFDRPYSVTEAWNIINRLNVGAMSEDTVYVYGTISSISQVEVIQYHNATYNITDGSKTVRVQYGRNLDNTDFYDEDEIQVGDRVVVYGQLMRYSSSTYEIAPYNYHVSLERDVEPPLFLPTSCMMANDEYAVVELYTNNEEEVVIYYTTNGNTPTNSSDIYSDDTGISLQGITNEVTIKAVAYTLDGTKHSAVNSETYRMVSPNTHGLFNHPFTVQQALDSLDVSSKIEGVYVSGVVCADPEFSLSNFMNANYYIADNLGDENQLYVFRGRFYYGEAFSSQEQLQYGDIVTVFGDLAIYNGQVKEFTARNYIVDLVRPSSIFIRPSEVTTNCRGISSSLNVYYNNLTHINSSELLFCDAQGNQVQASTYGWLTANLNSSTGNIDFQIEDNDSNAPRTAYLKLVVEDAGSPTPLISNVVPITQGICSASDFAILPFHYVGNESEVPAGITSDGLNENYGSSPYLKFDGVNDYMTLAFDEAPGELTFNIKGDKFKSSEFYLQTSTNNLDWDDLAIYTTQDMINSWAADNPKREIARVIGDPMAQSFPQLDANVRYIRWIMLTHSSDSKVRLGNIHLYKPIIYYNIAVTQPTIDETQVGTITTLEMAQENETVNLSIEYNANDYYFVEWVVEDALGNPVAVTDNHFTMPASNVTVTATLVETNQPCTYAYSVNGTIGEQNEVVVGSVIEQMPSSDNIVFNGQTFYFRGWTTDANDVTNLIRANSSYTIRQDVTFHAVYYQPEVGLVAEKHYAKVTNELSDWSGDYLIVYEDGNVAFNGSLQTLDAVGNTISVAISDEIITASETLDAAKFTIAAVDGGYSIQSASGKYIGKENNDNGMDESTEYDESFKNTISYDNGEIVIVGNGGAYLRYNSNSNQNRFRYFKSSTYTSQKPIQLYRYVGNVSNLYTRVFVDNPTGNLTITGPSIVPNGSVLEVTTITNNVGADRLLVDEGGQLVTGSNVDATVRKSITPYAEEHGKDNYYLIASPVNNLNPTTAGMTGDNFDLYAFDQSAQGEEWQNYEADNFNLAAGQGYLYANDYGGFINMGGTMAATADDVTIEHVAGKNLAGWNLIGNPYPCNVTIGKSYYRLAEGGAALAMDATAESVAIAPMEGVFVYADSEEEEVSFAKAPNTSTTGRGGNTLCLRVRHNQNTKDGRVEGDNAIVRFGEGSLLRKLVLNPDLPQIYVAQDGADYAIVNAEAEGELPISFRAAENGSYTISVNAEEVSFGYLHLIDNKTGADIDLLQTNNYTFDANTADYACRFKLVFATNSICEDVDGGNETFAYFNGSAWVLNGVDGGAILQVVDMTGRVILSNDAKAGISVNAMSQGIYVLRLIDGDNVKIQKIINK